MAPIKSYGWKRTKVYRYGPGEAASVLMGHRNDNLLQILIPMSLVILWTYTGLDKLLHWKQSWDAFHNQTFPSELAAILSYAVPVTELLLAVLLVFGMTRWWGLMGSVILLTIFNTYVGLIWWGAFPRVPCNCAGILESLGWAEHFWLNAGLIAMGIMALAVMKRNGKATECEILKPV